MSESEKKSKKSKMRTRCAANFGKVPLAYQWLKDFVTGYDCRDFKEFVLDFGCGDGRFVRWLHDEMNEVCKRTSFTVVGYDYDRPLADPTAQFDIVIASNVINVHPTIEGVKATLKEIRGRCRDRLGWVVVSYPTEPRKAGLTIKQVQDLLVEVMPDVDWQRTRRPEGGTVVFYGLTGATKPGADWIPGPQ